MNLQSDSFPVRSFVCVSLLISKTSLQRTNRTRVTVHQVPDAIRTARAVVLYSRIVAMRCRPTKCYASHWKNVKAILHAQRTRYHTGTWQHEFDRQEQGGNSISSAIMCHISIDSTTPLNDIRMKTRESPGQLPGSTGQDHVRASQD
eukprot:3328096-Pleurochrysis_carterae.AAC.2